MNTFFNDLIADKYFPSLKGITTPPSVMITLTDMEADALRDINYHYPSTELSIRWKTNHEVRILDIDYIKKITNIYWKERLPLPC